MTPVCGSNDCSDKVNGCSRFLAATCSSIMV